MLDSKPLRKAFSVDVAAISLVEQVPELVDQYIVEVEILEGRLRPHEVPGVLGLLHPAASVHFRFDSVAWLGRPTVGFDSTFLQWVKEQGASPLHSVAGESLLLTRHAAELDDF